MEIAIKRILVTGPGYTASQFKRLIDCSFEIIYDEEVTQERLAAILPSINAYILGGSERLDSTALANAPKLKIISFVGTGVGSFVDEAAAQSRGIQVKSTPGVMAAAVAEHTIGLLIGLVRGLFAQNESVKRLGTNPTTTLELSNMTVGIVGMGAIGTRVARILTTAFDCRVFYNSHSRKISIEEELGVEFFQIYDLFARCEAIILLVPTNPETIHLVNATTLSKARSGVFIVNTAGAKLVDPNALKAALISGHVASAAFDGYWIEPLPHPIEDPFGLLALPDSRFVVTPHTAAKTIGTWDRMINLAVENIINTSKER